jgi:hypothetical protein
MRNEGSARGASSSLEVLSGPRNRVCVRECLSVYTAKHTEIVPETPLDDLELAGLRREPVCV